MPWSSSDRRQRLPKDWPKIRAAVKRRAGGRCEAATHAPDCDGIGTDCDHIKANDDHSPANLQWLSLPCHKAKTAAERLSPKRATPKHPGLL